jgi:hypothetical protein
VYWLTSAPNIDLEVRRAGLDLERRLVAVSRDQAMLKLTLVASGTQAHCERAGL